MDGRPGWRVGAAGLARGDVWRRLRQWQSLDSAAVVAAADRDPERQERARRMAVPRVYAEPRALLAQELLDILYIAVSPVDQGPLAASALMRGLDLLVEPPLAVGADAARRLLTAARTYDGILLPAWPAVFDPAWRGLVENRRAVGASAHLEARLVLGYEPWWDDLEEDAADDPKMLLPGAIALGAEQLVHLALEVFGAPAEVTAQTDASELFGLPWEPRAILGLIYPWGTARLTVEVDLDQKASGSGGAAGTELVLDGEGGRLKVNGRRLLVNTFGEASSASVLPLAAGPGSHPPGWLVQMLDHSLASSGSLSSDRLRMVYRVVAALERSAAGKGKREPVEGPSVARIGQGAAGASASRRRGVRSVR